MTRLQDVNTTDLRAAIALGCRTMQNTFNADDDGVPFFGSTAWPHAALWFSPDLSECHLPGRHLNALLAAEAAAGIELDASAIESHRRAAFLSFSGPVRLPLNRQTMDGPLVNFSAHNLREGMHALYALACWRDDSDARALVGEFIAEIRRLWQPERGWDVAAFQARGLTFQASQGPLNGEARMIGPVVKYYGATGYGPALDLALDLKRVCVERFFLPDGVYDHARFVTDHAHSITSSMSSLAQLAALTGDEELFQRVRAFYDVGLWEMRDEIGWSPGGVFNRDSDQGEAGNGGDMVETALILARHGWTEYYSDAERMLRCHLLPCQLRDVSFMRDAPNPDGIDGLRDAARRHLGAYGLPAPYGHWPAGKGRESIAFYMDIVGSVVGSLCAALQETVRSDASGHWVNMLFDYDGPGVRVDSPYTHDGMRIVVKRPGALSVRLPGWADPAAIGVRGAPAPAIQPAGWLHWPAPPVGEEIRLELPLVETTLTLSMHVHPRPIRLRLRGDSPVTMNNFGSDLIFFEPFV